MFRPQHIIDNSLSFDAIDTPDSYTPTSWEQYSYDANDLAPLTNPNSNVPQSNWFTPKSTLVDALGRTIQTTEHKAHYNTIGAVYEDVVMKYSYDIRGNLLEVKDPYERNVFEHKYDLRPAQKDEQGKAQPLPPLWTKQIDSGISTVVFDATEKPIESEDAKGARSLNSYDTLNRPTNGWTQNNASDTLRLTAYSIYGEQATTPKTNNLNGQLWQQYNESGKMESVAFDFKGNLLSKQQQVISSAILKTALDNYQTYLVDWTGLPAILGTQIFETSSEYDALNRVTKITLPENVNSQRKEITPTYNRAGALEKVSYDSTEYVENIAYNAKGQRLLIAFGNGIMTRYVYDNRTFRLLRQRSEKYAKTQVGNTITYTPQSGTNKQDDKYIYDLIGNIFNINVRTTACGVGGTDSLDRVFDYDPLYRVTSGTGRENISGGSYPFPGWDDTTRSTDPNTTEAYTRKYTYDKVGNVQQVKQLGTNGFTRDFSYNTDKNSLDTVSIGSNNYNYTYDACSNQLTENTTRQFEWDAGNRLILFKNQTGSSEPSVIAQYLYDSSGNRVKKIVRKQGGSYEIRTYIDGIFEYFTDETDEQNTVHIMDDQSRVATVRIGDAMGDTTPAIKYNLENNIYSSTVILDDSGTLVNSQEYYPFGETSFGSYAKKRYQYVGKERDEESGLYYYGARYFSPWIARFISCDPLSAKYAQLSPYNYADNNPINDYDIDGMQNNNTEESAKGEPHKFNVSKNIGGLTNEEEVNNLPTNGVDVGEKIEVKHEAEASSGKYGEYETIKDTYKYLGNSVWTKYITTREGSFNAGNIEVKGSSTMEQFSNFMGPGTIPEIAKEITKGNSTTASANNYSGVKVSSGNTASNATTSKTSEPKPLLPDPASDIAEGTGIAATEVEAASELTIKELEAAKQIVPKVLKMVAKVARFLGTASGFYTVAENVSKGVQTGNSKYFYKAGIALAATILTLIPVVGTAMGLLIFAMSTAIEWWW